ncbi:unnamed protein product [Caenorhabditis angaria]|uniref:Uncharacterized protein n=1 Tax=Caenorhabditis angaria TaxID=860376 RepID=A0A9P1N048_9PELO|nr:unnamed protein product [Caenorhabditis angaria]
MFPSEFSARIQHFPHFFQQKRNVKCSAERVRLLENGELPELKYLDGCEIREAGEGLGIFCDRQGVTRTSYHMELMSNLMNSEFYPRDFLSDVSIVTTISALRSLLQQWIGSERSEYYQQNPHFCQNFGGKLYFHTISDFTSPIGTSMNMIHKYRITGSRGTWSEYLNNWNFGIAKLRLQNGIVIAYTYRFDAIFREKPIDIMLNSKQLDFLFIGAILTGKDVFIYRRIHVTNTSFLHSKLSYQKLWNELCEESKYGLEMMFSIDLPEFFSDLLKKSRNLEGVYSLSNVFKEFRLLRKYGRCPLIF